MIIVTTADRLGTSYSMPIIAESNLGLAPQHAANTATLRPQTGPRENSRVHFQQSSLRSGIRHQRTPPAREDRQQYDDHFQPMPHTLESHNHRDRNTDYNTEQDRLNDSQSDIHSTQSAQEQRQENEDLRKRNKDFERILNQNEKRFVGSNAHD